MSNTIEIKVPDIGDFSDIPVIEVLVSEGDQVSAEDGLVTLESDKATMEVPAPEAGTIREMKLKLDDLVSEGDVVAVLELAATGDSVPVENDDSSAGEPEIESDSVEPEPEQDSRPEPETDSEPAVEQPSQNLPRVIGLEAVDPAKVPYASPVIRRFARELGVDLGRVAGSGSKGRITREDVSGFVKSVMAGAAAPQAATAGVGGLNLDFPSLPEFDFSRYGDIEKQSLTRIQKISAGHLHR
ncbi:MAG: E3 binding domain-containing protein, partial [Xanthomonadales bacterium]|nr:E3 binding domain-containing protein [Xanthomonadales bacterium]